MKKIINVLLSLVMLMSITAGLNLTVFAKYELTVGQCGENATYSFDKSTGTLTISGEGDMDNYYVDEYDAHSGWNIDSDDDEDAPPDFASPFACNPYIKKVIIGKHITSVGNWSFLHCENLNEITIPNSVTSLGEGAFFYSGLESITLHDGIQHIGADVFTHTPYYNDENNWVDGILYVGNHLIKATYDKEQYTISPGTKTIAAFAFAHNPLQQIDIPQSVEYINEMSFWKCRNLKQLSLFGDIKSIGLCAFSYTDLKTVYFHANKEQWENVLVNVSAFSYENYEFESEFSEDIFEFDGDGCAEDETEIVSNTELTNAKFVFNHHYQTTTTKATLKKNGKLVQKCSVCGEVTKTTIYRPKTIKLTKKKYAYTGKAVKPKITVKDAKGKTISKKYYTVTYKNNKKVGKATATVKFKGRYKGTKKLTFKIIYKGWRKQSGKWYYYDANGNKVTGWQKISKKWYYFSKKGVMQTGWLKDAGNWYYLDGGVMLANTSKIIDGKTYQFDKDGVCLNP